MVKPVRDTMIGVAALVLLCVNTLFWAVPLYAVTILKLLIPIPAWRRFCSRVLAVIAEAWIGCNSAVGRLIHPTVWEVRGMTGLERERSYLVNSNHQSWVDIPVLQNVFNRRIPLLRFFLKQELMWVPVLNGAWWALDFPFMKRYPKELIEKRPELRGRDLEATRRACARLAHGPVSILNFLEGTRFTIAKHARQRSPYRHLLRPKAGGTAFALAALSGKIDTMLDVTIVYPERKPTFWDFLAGRLRQVIVHVEQIDIPRDLSGGRYEEDEAFRERFQTWINELWERKDDRIEQLLMDAVPPLWRRPAA